MVKNREVDETGKEDSDWECARVCAHVCASALALWGGKSGKGTLRVWHWMDTGLAETEGTDHRKVCENSLLERGTSTLRGLGPSPSPLNSLTSFFSSNIKWAPKRSQEPPGKDQKKNRTAFCLGRIHGVDKEKEKQAIKIQGLCPG